MGEFSENVCLKNIFIGISKDFHPNTDWMESFGDGRESIRGRNNLGKKLFSYAWLPKTTPVISTGLI